ncbi:hypothetical protein CEXT_767001 [Caerostris extrusa]|uniref:C2 domain-containing protein n=1 Tax=Caerostris extrusa TaxID=172846 RepID=A0AAV4S3Z0_CAEEX|nr:hypothetical protein CEXT_767001 [Caerostris extrusa]
MEIQRSWYGAGTEVRTRAVVPLPIRKSGGCCYWISIREQLSTKARSSHRPDNSCARFQQTSTFHITLIKAPTVTRPVKTEAHKRWRHKLEIDVLPTLIHFQGRGRLLFVELGTSFASYEMEIQRSWYGPGIEVRTRAVVPLRIRKSGDAATGWEI